MPKFFADPASFAGDRVTLTGEVADHITKSLRMMPGERVTLCDGAGTDYSCVIDAVGREVLLTVEEEVRSDTEPPYRAVVYQALSKGDRFDTVVQKSVEFGAVAIVPVQTERATVRLSADDCARKAVRWQKIANSAAEQCGRGILPQVCPLMSFKEAVEEAGRDDIALFCYEDEKGTTLKEILEEITFPEGRTPTVAILIGPEGGFSEKEARLGAETLRSVSLGPRILRTESAAPFVLACLSYVFEL